MAKKYVAMIIAVLFLATSLAMTVDSDAETKIEHEPLQNSLDFLMNPQAINTLNEFKKPGCEPSTWDDETKTLVLKGIDIVFNSLVGIELPENSVVTVEKDSSITMDHSSSSDATKVIMALSNKINTKEINGNGKLTININDSGRCREIGGICDAKKISCNVEVNITTANSNVNYGIFNERNDNKTDLTLENCVISVRGGGIYADENLFVNGCVINIENNEGCPFGIKCYKNVMLKDSALTISIDTDDSDSRGVYAESSLEIDNTRLSVNSSIKALETPEVIIHNCKDIAVSDDGVTWKKVSDISEIQNYKFYKNDWKQDPSSNYVGSWAIIALAIILLAISAVGIAFYSVKKR